MVQGKFKSSKSNLSAASLAKVVPKKTKAKQAKAKKHNNGSIQKIVQQNLESSMKNTIEKDLCKQVKSMEGKSFNILK